jgi:hypothetical protein
LFVCFVVVVVVVWFLFFCFFFSFCWILIIYCFYCSNAIKCMYTNWFSTLCCALLQLHLWDNHICFDWIIFLRATKF